MSPFGQLLFETAAECASRPARELDQELTRRVRAWVDDQQRIPEPVIPAEGEWK